MFKLGLMMLVLVAGEPPRPVAVIEGTIEYKTKALCEKAGQEALQFFGVVIAGQRSFIVGEEFAVKPVCRLVPKA